MSLRRSEWIALSKVWLPLLVLASCGGEVDRSVEPTVRDSAGIRIVEYAGPLPHGPELAVADEPELRHGHRDGDYLFQRIVDGALRPDGGAVVVDGGNREVVSVTSGGELESTVAPTGRGPGEVRRPRSVHVLGRDTVLIEDGGNARLTWFVAGEVARSVSTAGDPALGRDLGVVGVGPDGGVLMATRGFRPPDAPGWVPGTFVRFDSDTGVADSVAGYDLALWRGVEGAADPFPPGGVVTVSDDRFVLGRTDVPELRWRTLRGELSQIVRWEAEGRRPTEEDLAAFRTLLRDDLTRLNRDLEGRRLEALVERELERYSTLPDEPLPLFGALVGDGAGGVWVGEYVVGAPQTPVPRYDIVSADGRGLGSVTLPENLRVLDLEDDRLLGVLTDELGVESLAVFSLTSPGDG